MVKDVISKPTKIYQSASKRGQFRIMKLFVLLIFARMIYTEKGVNPIVESILMECPPMGWF